MAKVKTDETSDDAARREARQLIRTLRRDLAALTAFVDAEESSLDRKRVPSKRVARLRLICQDVSSAKGFTDQKV